MKRYTPVLQPGGTIGMQSIPGNATGAWVQYAEAQAEIYELWDCLARTRKYLDKDCPILECLTTLVDKYYEHRLSS